MTHLHISPFYGRKIASLPAWKRAVTSIFPLHVLYVLRTELQLLWVRLTSGSVRRRYRGATNLKVNVGSGARGQAGWVNVDFMARPSVNCVCDCRKVLRSSRNCPASIRVKKDLRAKMLS